MAQTDLRGRYVVANPCYCALTGRSKAQLLLMRMEDTTHPEDRAEHQRHHAQLLATGTPAQHRKRYLRPDQTEVFVLSHLSVLRDAAGRPEYVLASVQDLTAQRASDGVIEALRDGINQRIEGALGQRMVAAEREAQARRVEVLGQLAAGVAHDFNNVLQAIGGGARLLQRRPDNAETVARLATLMLDAVGRGALITQRLLSFAGRSEATPLPVALPAVIAAVVAAGNAPAFTSDVPAGLPDVLADASQLETVIASILMNAAEAARGPDVPAIHLSAIADAGARFVTITVTDRSGGMDANTLSRVTEPFFSTKPRARATGLGLAMAQGFAEQAGGTLEIASEPGVGTTVTLRLRKGLTAWLMEHNKNITAAGGLARRCPNDLCDADDGFGLSHFGAGRHNASASRRCSGCLRPGAGGRVRGDCLVDGCWTWVPGRLVAPLVLGWRLP